MRNDAAARTAVLRGARLLVVDDDATARQTLLDMARALGLFAEEAAEGSEALNKVSGAARSGVPFDLVIIDLRMPGMDGIECARQMSADPSSPRPALLIVSTMGFDETLRQVRTSNIRLIDRLSKPRTPSMLFDVCVSALGRAVGAYPRAAETAACDPSKILGGARVLLAEDHELNLELAFELLSNAGAEVTIARDGQQALDRLAEQKFDIVLLDCQMPVMDGYETVQIIRADPRLRDLPVIAVTASVMSEDRERALSVGMDDHIPKPLDVASMLRTIAQWLQVKAVDRL
jgi:CheY-like chemotaxis protein